MSEELKGHGHVTPNADGFLARCGGPSICKVCKAELATLKAQEPAEYQLRALIRDVTNIPEAGYYMPQSWHDQVIALSLSGKLDAPVSEAKAQGVVIPRLGKFTTSAGGRSYVAEFFKAVLQRHDFTTYINERLAADFACALADGLCQLNAATAAFPGVVIGGLDVAKDRFEVKLPADMSPATVQLVSVPDGYVLVPQRMELTPADIASIMFHCGGDEEATEVDEMFVGGVLWVGDIKDDDDNLVHGLHIATADYPEEGSTTLVEFAAAPAPSTTEGQGDE